MPTIDLETAEDGGRVNLPADVYTIRILDAEKRDSAKGNPMLVLSQEIAAPDSVMINGQKTRIAGLRLTDWIMLSDRGLSTLKKLHKLLELPMQVNTDALPTDQYKGKALSALVMTEVDTMKRKGSQEVIVNPDTGTPIESFNYRVKEYMAAKAELNKVGPF